MMICFDSLKAPLEKKNLGWTMLLIFCIQVLTVAFALCCTCFRCIVMALNKWMLFIHSFFKKVIQIFKLKSEKEMLG